MSVTPTPPSPGRGRKVFVSYAGQDRDWAEWIALVLRNSGFSVELDKWSWRVGTSFIANIDAALENAEFVVAVCSAHYFDRGSYGSDERDAALRLAHHGKKRIIPVMVAPCEPTALIGTLSRVNLTSADRDTGADLLLAAFEEPTGPALGAEPVWPGGVVPAPSVPSSESGHATVPEIWNIPPRIANFTDRTTLLATVAQELRGGAEGLPVAITALQGMAGVGKTQVATEYAWRNAEDYDIGWWVNSENPALISSQIAALGTRIGVSSDGISDQAAAVLDRLRHMERWLLVFDNAEDPTALRDWIPGGGGHVLITSRSPKWGNLAFKLEVDVLPQEESVRFLQSRRIDGMDDEIANRIAEEVGNLPLALEQCAAYLVETGVSPRKYLDRFLRRRSEYLARGEDLFYGGTIHSAVRLSWERLVQDSRISAQLLMLAAFFGPEPIPLQILQANPDAVEEPLRSALRDEDDIDLDDALSIACNLSLARRSDDSFILHRLVQVILRSIASPADAERQVAAVRSFLIGYRGDLVSDDPKSWPRWQAIAPHVLAAPALNPDIDSERVDPESRRLILDVCRNLWDRGDVGACRTAVESTHTRWVAALGEQHHDTLAAAHLLAVAQFDLGEVGEARRLATSVLTTRRELLGIDHPDTLATASNLVRILRGMSEYAEAQRLGEEALTTRRAVLGADHPDTLGSAASLARTFAGQGQFEKSTELDRETYEHRVRVLGPNHPDTLGSATNLIDDYTRSGNGQEARKLGLETYRLARVELGETHPQTLNVAYNLAGALYALGDYGGARRLDEETLEGATLALGEAHPNTLNVVTNLASDLAALGDLERAIALGSENLDRLRETLYEDWFTVVALHNLVIDLRASGNTEKAQELEAEESELRGRLPQTGGTYEPGQRAREWWWARGY